MPEKSAVNILARIIGLELMRTPYTNQSRIPVTKKEYINREMPEVSLVFTVLMTWGMNEAVVIKAATKPRRSIILFDLNEIKNPLNKQSLSKGL